MANATAPVCALPGDLCWKTGEGRTRTRQTYGGVGLWLLAGLLLLPVLTLLAALLLPDAGGLAHLGATVLPRYLRNAVLLLTGVGTLSFLLGTLSAWAVTMYEFPGRRILSWALMLPIAVPAYVLAMLYGWQLEAAGPVQTALRDWLGIAYGDYWFPDVRSTGGAILMLALSKYAYVYMLARIAFLQQSCQLFESARTLGVRNGALFLRVGLPAARPAIAVALALVGMETLADFGTVSLLGVESFTTGIYRTWFGLGDPIAAAKLSAMLLLFAFALLSLERRARRHARHYNATAVYHPLPRFPLRGLRAFGVSACCALPVLLGFAIPTAQLLGWSLDYPRYWLDASTWTALSHVMLLAITVVALTLAVAVYFARALRRELPGLLRQMIRFAASGYAVPGSVAAIGVLIPLAWLDRHLADSIESVTGMSPGLLLTGSIAAIVFACLFRFLAVALGSVESSLGAVTPMMDDAARMLGCRNHALLGRIHLPMMKGGLLVGGIMVFVDVVKELPATIILRPFNFDTLAIRVFELARDEQLYAAAPAALLMIGVGLLPICLLQRHLGRCRPSGAA